MIYHFLEIKHAAISLLNKTPLLQLAHQVGKSIMLTIWIHLSLDVLINQPEMMLSQSIILRTRTAPLPLSGQTTDRTSGLITALLYAMIIRLFSVQRYIQELTIVNIYACIKHANGTINTILSQMLRPNDSIYNELF